MSPDIHDIHDIHRRRQKNTNDDTHDTHDTQKNDSFLVAAELGATRARRMTDSSARASDGASLRATLRRDGYALLRGFLDARDVERARAVALEALAASKPDVFLEKEKGLLRPDARALGLLSRQDVARAEIQKVTECDALFDVAARVLFSDDDDDGLDAKTRCKDSTRTERSSNPSPRLAMTTAYKWLRAVAGASSPACTHGPRVPGGGSGRLVTAGSRSGTCGWRTAR